MDRIPTINVCITKKSNWGLLFATLTAFGLGVLYGKFSMAKYQEQEEKEDEG